MDREAEPTGASPPDHRRGEEREVELRSSTERTTPPGVTDSEAQTESTPEPRLYVPPVPVTGIANPGFTEDPPPYSPPDPKTVHLLYPSFPTNMPGQGAIFFQPAPLQQALNRTADALPESYPFTIYNSSLFSEIPIEVEQERPPKDYMVESVLVMIFCCLLTGVMAFVYSDEARTAVSQGDLVRAKAASRKARLLVAVSLFFGFFVSSSWVIYVVMTLYE
ncbi:proline rich transmembrane protein 1B [Elgaria multicarinata webbii]|uniref:proline rich transmembrane protein 1B n=1 Tax=Elgaria multicarinata webbii TaxID=159646 RepID=UPI002FCCF1E4